MIPKMNARANEIVKPIIVLNIVQPNEIYIVLFERRFPTPTTVSMGLGKTRFP